LKGRQLFIYWRCPAPQAAAAQGAARAMQARLCKRHPGLLARLFVRTDEAGDPGGGGKNDVTLMETYALRSGDFAQAATEGIGSALQAELQAAGTELQPWLSGGRHIEVFELLD
jgi:hypothetical protein